MRNLILSVTLMVASLFGATAHAEFEAGKQYVELNNPVQIAKPGKIEVVELLPDDVNFVRIPAMFGGMWNVHGQLFITLEAMKAGPKVHAAVFDGIHKQGKKLATPEEMADFLAGEGIDKDTFLKTYNSFGVKSQLEKAKKLAMAYQISGVPVMVVNGKYRFDIGSAGGPQKVLQVADHLIGKERAAQ